MADCIAYYRVSTDRQGASGRGLDSCVAALAFSCYGTERCVPWYGSMLRGQMVLRG